MAQHTGLDENQPLVGFPHVKDSNPVSRTGREDGTGKFSTGFTEKGSSPASLDGRTGSDPTSTLDAGVGRVVSSYRESPDGAPGGIKRLDLVNEFSDPNGSRS